MQCYCKEQFQEHFPAVVHVVLIIKPDNFWEKHKTSVSSGKYKFEVQMISVDGLMRYIEPAQLTRDLGGTLFYDHDEWLETRLVSFIVLAGWNTSHLDGWRRYP